MAKKPSEKPTSPPEIIYIVTCNKGTEDEYRVVCNSAEEACDSAQGSETPYSFATYEKVSDVTIIRTVVVTTEEKV